MNGKILMSFIGGCALCCSITTDSCTAATVDPMADAIADVENVAAVDPDALTPQLKEASSKRRGCLETLTKIEAALETAENAYELACREDYEAYKAAEDVVAVDLPADATAEAKEGLRGAASKRRECSKTLTEIKMALETAKNAYALACHEHYAVYTRWSNAYFAQAERNIKASEELHRRTEELLSQPEAIE